MDLRLLSSILMLCALGAPMLGAIVIFAGAAAWVGWLCVGLGGACLVASFMVLQRARREESEAHLD